MQKDETIGQLMTVLLLKSWHIWNTPSRQQKACKNRQICFHWGRRGGRWQIPNPLGEKTCWRKTKQESLLMATTDQE